MNYLEHDFFPAGKQIPDSLLATWQKILDLCAGIAAVKAALIMRVSLPHISVFLSSHSKDNPYHRGDKEFFNENCGLYCENVIRTRSMLNIPDALDDPVWDSNPDIKLGMVSYLGLPLRYPDNRIFGTICMLDNKPHRFSGDIQKLLELFRDMIESQLEYLHQRDIITSQDKTLKILQGLLPVCSSCKKIRRQDGTWEQIESYIDRHSEAKFSHGICPECARRLYGVEPEDYI